MKAASDAMDFEKAIEYRDLLSSVKKVAQKQKITSSNMEDRDIIAMARDDMDAVVQVFFVREGQADWTGSFPYVCGNCGDKGADSFQLCKAVLCRNSIFAQGAVGAV